MLRVVVNIFLVFSDKSQLKHIKIKTTFKGVFNAQGTVRLLINKMKIIFLKLLSSI